MTDDMYKHDINVNIK